MLNGLGFISLHVFCWLPLSHEKMYETHTHTHWAHRGKVANDKRKIGWVLFSFCVGKQTKGASVARLYNEENVNRLNSICIHIVNCRECVFAVCTFNADRCTCLLPVPRRCCLCAMCECVLLNPSIVTSEDLFPFLSLLLLLSIVRLQRNCIILM